MSAESVRPKDRHDKPRDGDFEYLVSRPDPPGFCRPGLGCRYCWPDQCKWQDAADDRVYNDGSDA